MLKEFLAWWTTQMLGLNPWARPAGTAKTRGLIVATRTPLNVDPPTVELLFGNGRTEGSLGTFTLSENGTDAFQAAVLRYHRWAHDVTLRVFPDVLLERQVVLPLLAEREPERVLEYEIDRLTPFKIDEVVWTWTIDRRDRERGVLHLLLSFLPTATLRGLLTALERGGVTPSTLEAISGGNQTRRIALRRADTRANRWENWGLTLAGAACVVLAVAAVAMPFITQVSQRRAVEARYAALAPKIAQVEKARREIAARAAGQDVFSAERIRVGDPIEILAALTDILPDETYLTDMTLRQRKLTLNGQSAAAARLITMLSDNRVVRDPVFAAPVTRVDNGRADLFSIRAEVAP